jgi:2-succinyl-5-enolpyruvyl-6-hydroxy-3-cyclohexene-1-carboxylate synthase
MFGEGILQDVKISDVDLLDLLLTLEESTANSFKDTWLKLSSKAQGLSSDYMHNTEFSDLKAFETLVQTFPSNSNIQYGNSTPIRYSNLFKHDKSLTVNANRGTSGIDGCLSTAAGAAYVKQQFTICIIGDISFLYDSNALWNNHLSPDLRIIIINNGGGNIFRLIDGPTKLANFETFFETKHNFSAKHLASMYNLPYYICDSQAGLDAHSKDFYEPSARPKILEIKTDGEISAKVYREYFEFLAR